MGTAEVIYRSAGSKTEEQVRCYSQTHEAPHRYLAYRDVPLFIRQFVKGKRALDFGAGTGASSSFLLSLGLDVVGVDISLEMLKTARFNFPHIPFYNVKSRMVAGEFDLIFSSFVLFELASMNDMVQYLSKAFSFLKEGGVFIGVTGDEQLYSSFRNWMTFDANFEENRNLCSGAVARLALKSPGMEFYDYFWKEADYREGFERAGLKILQTHHPLGLPEDPYDWKDELWFSPFTIFIAEKPSQLQ